MKKIIQIALYKRDKEYTPDIYVLCENGDVWVGTYPYVNKNKIQWNNLLRNEE